MSLDKAHINPEDPNDNEIYKFVKMDSIQNQDQNKDNNLNFQEKELKISGEQIQSQIDLQQLNQSEYRDQNIVADIKMEEEEVKEPNIYNVNNNFISENIDQNNIYGIKREQFISNQLNNNVNCIDNINNINNSINNNNNFKSNNNNPINSNANNYSNNQLNNSIKNNNINDKAEFLQSSVDQQAKQLFFSEFSRDKPNIQNICQINNLNQPNLNNAFIMADNNNNNNNNSIMNSSILNINLNSNNNNYISFNNFLIPNQGCSSIGTNNNVNNLNNNNFNKNISINNNVIINNNNNISNKLNMIPPNASQDYYKIAHTSRLIEPFDERKDPYMKINVTKSNIMGDNEKTYIITRNGMLNTKKNTETRDIMIGRQSQFTNSEQLEVHPNDIVLSPNVQTDRTISRIHCKIIYSEGFYQKRKIPDSFLQFLVITNSPRSTSVWRGLPKHICMLVWEYAQPKKTFYVVDIGSVLGTYLRVKVNSRHKLQGGNMFLVGSDTTFNILEIYNGNPNSKLIFDQTQSDKNLFSKIAQDFRERQALVHGLTNADQQLVKQISENNLDATQKLFQPIYSRPFVVVEVYLSNSISLQSSNQQIHYFIEDPIPKSKEFKIGRSQDSEIMINQQTISRKQCKIQYVDGDWYMMDGDGKKESSNGTWVSLTDYTEKKKQIQLQIRQESEPKEIEDGSEIKISDSILKIEIYNNGKSSRKSL